MSRPLKWTSPVDYSTLSPETKSPVREASPCTEGSPSPAPSPSSQDSTESFMPMPPIPPEVWSWIQQYEADVTKAGSAVTMEAQPALTALGLARTKGERP